MFDLGFGLFGRLFSSYLAPPPHHYLLPTNYHHYSPLLILLIARPYIGCGVLKVYSLVNLLSRVRALWPSCFLLLFFFPFGTTTTSLLTPNQLSSLFSSPHSTYSLTLHWLWSFRILYLRECFIYLGFGLFGCLTDLSFFPLIWRHHHITADSQPTIITILLSPFYLQLNLKLVVEFEKLFFQEIQDSGSFGRLHVSSFFPLIWHHHRIITILLSSFNLQLDLTLVVKFKNFIFQGMFDLGFSYFLPPFLLLQELSKPKISSHARTLHLLPKWVSHTYFNLLRCDHTSQVML